MKILVNVPISIYSGYGNDGLGIVRALVSAGHDVYIEATHVAAPVPRDILPLLGRPVQGPFDIAIIHVDPAILQASDIFRANAKVVIGWTMWEYSNLDNLQTFEDVRARQQKHFEWAMDLQRYDKRSGGIAAEFLDGHLAAELDAEKEKFRQGLENFDVLVGYDQNTVSGLSEYFDGPCVVVQGGYEPDRWKPVERDWNGPFHFCQIGVLSERKDPFVTLRAFFAAQEQDEEFAENARLSLKTTQPGIHSKIEMDHPNVRIFYDIWSESVVREFYAANHVLVSPSRGEGKNMPALEFMSTGGAVIATNWGGHTGWLSRDYSYPLDYTLEPEHPGSTALNARASEEHLTDLMLHTFHHRAEVREFGHRASNIIPVMLNWPAVVERLFVRCSDVVPDHAAMLRAAAQALGDDD